ncbi:MAG: hypothetical protein JW818_05070 [Pirellulales bacterium]|nr:hypothetical protein [Pirellulales bacterium]
MSALVRCKACNYIMKESALGEVCPACGVKRKVFEPYEDRVSARRRFLLDLDSHPILVHFPQALVSMLPVLVAANLWLPSLYGPELIVVTCFTVLVLPFSVMGAIASGLFDAKLKFKKLSPPAVVRKIVTGSLLLVLTTANAAFLCIFGYEGTGRWIVLALALGSLGCAVLLGVVGKKLIPAILPGK